MVMEVAEALEGRVDVYKVMVDRICTSRDITPESVSVRLFFIFCGVLSRRAARRPQQHAHR